jgi:hypothetical protein
MNAKAIPRIPIPAKTPMTIPTTVPAELEVAPVALELVSEGEAEAEDEEDVSEKVGYVIDCRVTVEGTPWVVGVLMTMGVLEGDAGGEVETASLETMVEVVVVLVVVVLDDEESGVEEDWTAGGVLDEGCWAGEDGPACGVVRDVELGGGWFTTLVVE